MPNIETTMTDAISAASSALSNNTSSSSINLNNNSSNVSSSSEPSTLQNVRRAWRNIACASANCCLGADGTVNQDNARNLQTFWNNLKPGDPPNNSIPGIEFMQEQILAVLGKLVGSSNSSSSSSSSTSSPASSPLANKLNGASAKTLSGNGNKILKAMIQGLTLPENAEKISKISENSNDTAAASQWNEISLMILQSLFTPHRQMSLPTCSINALINAEIFNNPERLAEIYLNILTHEAKSKIDLPIENAGQLQALNIATGANSAHIVVTPNQFKNNLQYVFKISALPESSSSSSPSPSDNISSSFSSVSSSAPVVPSPSSEILQGWKNQGIKYMQPTTTASSAPATGGPQLHSLGIQIHDLNDVFFANFMEQIYKDTDQARVFINVRELYFGIRGDELDFANAIKSSDFPVIQLESSGSDSEKIDVPLFTGNEIEKLIDKAKKFNGKGIRYGYVTVFTQLKSPNISNDLDPYHGHVENLDFQKFTDLSLNRIPVRGNSELGPQKVTDGQFRKIGDRNWVSEDGYPNYLGIAKVKVFVQNYVKIKRKRDPDSVSKVEDESDDEKEETLSKEQEMYFFETVSYFPKNSCYETYGPYKGWMGFHKSKLDNK
jgi:hypothetical protein